MSLDFVEVRRGVVCVGAALRVNARGTPNPIRVPRGAVGSRRAGIYPVDIP